MEKAMDQDTFLEAPFAGWSPLPGRIPPVDPPYISKPPCQLLNGNLYRSCNASRCVVPAQQPVVPVPVYQEIRRKDRIVEVPQTIIKDRIIPKLYNRQVTYEVPKINVEFREKVVTIPRVEYRQKIVEVPVPVGYKYNIIKKWNIREVPKVIPKYMGTQENIYVEVPQLQLVDKTVHKEIPVYVGEKIVQKQIIEEDPVEVVEYRYVEQEKEVPVYKYKPVFDVEVDIPPPLLIPVPVKPREIQLKPERLSIDEWRKIQAGGTSQCCNEGGSCAQNPKNILFSCCDRKNKCTASCQPGGVFSPTGACGSLCRNKIYASSNAKYVPSRATQQEPVQLVYQ